MKSCGRQMVRTWPCTVPPEGLTAEVLSVPLVRIRDGSGSPHFGGPEGWIHGLSMSRVRIGLPYPHIASAINELRRNALAGNLVQIMVNKLHAGSTLDPHRDGLPDHARYHLPIVTNDAAYWWDEIGGRRRMETGWWYGPVPYCGILHSVGNPGPTDRIHIIADFVKGKQ